MPSTTPWPAVPRSLLRADRKELTALTLNVVEGVVPADLKGHVFLVAPVGTVESQGLPDPDGNTVMNGDGIIVRLDCDGGAVKVTTRLAKTPDYIADEATAGEPLPLRFFSSGIARISALLGARDFVNTAFLPMHQGAETRLLATYDAGRPFELDPVTLELVTPVGAFPEWQAATLEDLPFPLVLSPAHPAFDRLTGEFFTANYSRSVENFARAIPLIGALRSLPHWVADRIEHLADAIGIGARTRRTLRRASRLYRRFEDRVNDAIGRVPNVPEDFTDAVVWDGDGALRRYRLFDRDTKLRVEIRQSIHQVAVTERYVIFLDTGFKIGPDQGFNDPAPRKAYEDRAIRTAVTRPQIPNTVFWIVKREDLQNAGGPPTGDEPPQVPALRIEIPFECDHFLADYDDAGRIVLHAAHANATDLSEWVRDYDRSAFDDSPCSDDLRGMLAVGAMDVNRLGRYEIDPDRGCLTDAKVIADDDCTWALALYAGKDLNTPAANPLEIDQIYWASEGFFVELLTQFVYELYEEYPHRLTPLRAVRAMPGQGGRPAWVLRLDTKTMQLADRYQLPDGHMIGSMQYAPRGAGPTEGYLVCTVYTPQRVEVWVFDAADLTLGPVCRLHHPELVIGFSLHSAWLPDIAPRTSSYRVTAAEDFGDLGRFPRPARRVLEQFVIPGFY